MCLQEVQSDHYEQHLNPFMQTLGYEGIFKQKSRESMGVYGKVRKRERVCVRESTRMYVMMMKNLKRM